jgi:hypothetical protein
LLLRAEISALGICVFSPVAFLFPKSLTGLRSGCTCYRSDSQDFDCCLH